MFRVCADKAHAMGVWSLCKGAAVLKGQYGVVQLSTTTQYVCLPAMTKQVTRFSALLAFIWFEQHSMA